MLHYVFTILVAFSAPKIAHAEPALDQPLPSTSLEGDEGGRVDGSAWSSSMIRDKVWAVLYVDPDKKDSNEKLEASLTKEQNFPPEKYASMAIINMDATWLPNGIIASSLKSKQEKYPLTVYVKDLKRKLVKAWGVKDDEYNFIIFDKQGNVKFYGSGAFSDAEIEKAINTIKSLL